jgi:hypothetical protein
MADTKKLLEVLGRLVDSGNTVLVIEHNLDGVKTSDWIIDLGPEGGAAGGEVIAAGTPEDVAEIEASFTGQFLRPLLIRERKRAAGRARRRAGAIAPAIRRVGSGGRHVARQSRAQPRTLGTPG